MKYQGTLIAVSDMKRARQFYEDVMEQKVISDFGANITFEGGLSLQAGYEELVGENIPQKVRPNNFQLYFEVNDLDCWQKKLKEIKDIEFIHDIREYPWGQRVMRFYDYDKFIVEVSENMEYVARRFLAQGLSIEETAARTQFPVEFVKNLL